MSVHEEAAKRLRADAASLCDGSLRADLALVLEEYERRGAKIDEMRSGLQALHDVGCSAVPFNARPCGICQGCYASWLLAKLGGEGE